MNEPLRPMSTGQLLDHTFALYRQNFLLFVGIATVGPAASVIFQLLTVGANVTTSFGVSQPGVAPHLGLGTGVTAIVSVVLGYVIMLAGLAISHAATVKAVAAVHLGRETSVVGAYKALRGRIWSVFGTVALILLWVLLWMLLAGMLIGVVMIPLSLGFRFLASAPNRATGAIIAGVVFFCMVLLIFGVLIAVYVRYALAIQACVVEGLGPRASLKRSIFLSKGGRWRVVVVYLIFAVLAGVLGWGLTEIARGLGTLLHNRIAAAVLVYVAGFVVGSITGPLATIGLSLLYYDERVRKEAFDLQLMLLSLDVPGAPSVTPTQTTPAQI
jgi:uncharacterized membrane protein